MQYKTEQEVFWAGKFGREYILRNQSSQLLAGNLSFFSHALKLARSPRSCLELGASIGANLQALKLLYPGAALSAVEINSDACKVLTETFPDMRVTEGSIFDYSEEDTHDLVLVKGVLIHLNPDRLPEVYDILAKSCRKHLLIAEYYNPSPLAIDYRGHSGKLFKRDFAGEMLDRHRGFRLADYGFVYRRDPAFPLDDITWFLLEKN